MPGHPCLYLASQAELCWYECGKPKKFAISKFDIPQTEGDNMKFIDFSEELVPLRHAFFGWFHDRKDIEQKRRYFLKYICTYPLRAACSIAVEHPNSSFVEEYIIPQLLLQWVLEDGYFDGIRYESCSPSEEVKSLGGHNIVLITRAFDKEGYDFNLRKKIKVGEPKVFDINKINNKLKRNIKADPFAWGLEGIPENYEGI